MGEVGIEHARAKLTRRLKIVGRQEDGYHLLDAEMVTIDLADELEFGEGDSLEVIDEIAWRTRKLRPTLAVPSDPSNLVVRAAALAGSRAAVRLHKRIPPGGGLGGGSADGAAVLRHFGVTDLAIAIRLGADVPFCIRGGRAVASGIGEVLHALPFEGMTLVLVTPDFGVSTVDAYRAYDELERASALPPGLVNDLEPAALALEPRLARLRELLSAVAGERPTLAGSGSSYFFECDAARATTLAADLAGALGEQHLTALVRVSVTTPN